MRLLVVVNSNDAETVSNALRIGAFCLAAEDRVTVFLFGAGVEVAGLTDPEFAVIEKARAFIHDGGEILACGTCLQRRSLGASPLYHISDLKALHDLITHADKVLSF